MKKKVLAICGYIGSGKTFAGNYLKSLGAVFVDADGVVDRLYQPNAGGWLKILNFFGEEYLLKNRQINRKKLAKFVFGDKNKLAVLNSLIHPLVKNEVMKAIDQADSKFVVVEAIVLKEGFLMDLVDQVLWIDVPRNFLVERLVSGRSMAEVLQRVASQERPSRIDYEVVNDGDLDLFRNKLKMVWNEFSRS
jgi:dephospho-CoA kinase